MIYKLFLILGIIVLYLIIQILYSGYYLYVGRRIAQNKFFVNKTLGDEHNTKIKLFISGDSVAVGVGASSFETSVAGRIASYLAQKNFIQYENQAISGAKMVKLLDMPIPKEKQDLMVLIISSNDLFYFTPVEQFKISTKQVIDRYAPLTNKLIIVGPGRVFDGQAVPIPMQLYYKYKGPQYADILNSISSNYPNVIYLDPLKTPIDKSKYGGSVTAQDQFHPNDKGYQFWFDLIKPQL